MALNIDQSNVNLETNAATFLSAKAADRSESDKKKMALGDIKNAPTGPTSSEKITVNKNEPEQEPKVEDFEYASSEPVDYMQVWIEKEALTDDQINKLIKMMWSNECDETEPPQPVKEPMFYSEPESDPERPEVPNLTEPMTPDSSSSEYHSCDESDDETFEQNVFNGAEMSALNLSIFDLSYVSEENLSF